MFLQILSDPLLGIFSSENKQNQRKTSVKWKNNVIRSIEKGNLRVREETGSRESSEEEEDANKENGRQVELVHPPISFNRFGFHVKCVWRVFFLLYVLRGANRMLTDITKCQVRHL